MTDVDYAQLSADLVSELKLAAPPIGIAFLDTAPAQIDAFDEPMPAATPDGRTGRVPAGCVLGEPLHHVARLDLVKYPMTQADLGGLALRLLAGLESGSVDLEHVAAVAARVSFPRDDEVDAWQQFDWITDEKDLIERGAKDGAGFEAGVVAALRRAAAYARR